MHTCVARIISHSQRVAIIIGVHREEPHSEGSVLGIRSAVFKIFQVNAKLIVALDGQSMDLLESCAG